MAKDLGTSTFFPAETWKGLKKKSTLYKEEGEPIKTVFEESSIRDGIFFYRGRVFGNGVGRSFLITIQVYVAIFASLSTSDYLGWVASYEFSCFNWKTG